MDMTRRGDERLVSGSDDGFIGIWDSRSREAVAWMQTDFPVTAVCVTEIGHEVYSGGLDNEIKVWDLRRMEVMNSLVGHADTVTSLRISPDQQTLLSHAHDATVRTWDIRPFAPSSRLLKTFDGAVVGLEKNLFKAAWNCKGDRIAAGCGDRSVMIWEAASGKLVSKLPGHKGAVNDVCFSPDEEPICEFVPRGFLSPLIDYVFVTDWCGFSGLGFHRRFPYAWRSREMTILNINKISQSHDFPPGSRLGFPIL